ncbi:AraC family transcriptional regulator [Cellvibrio polysaccharolyticus]|uniref:AraC family transcriptional regulator n=1 Tax=Cellvibrio polysaccharolyticus TaxID=2082724 RepID=A0A928YSJ2_9GAMM|nr:helix-turn-helix domain-containing protein [Cellvibrio polysaccharolyticus]MBE8716069.1 AraC family transcriptional regulator [Cellvibrio polysaccharolyticus]
MVNEVLFNFHDVVLLMTAMQCTFFALLLLATNSGRAVSNYFLAAFLIAHALIPLHELILWGAVFKWKIRENWPEAFFVGGIAYYLDAVLLYFYIKSLVFRDFCLKKRDSLHLIPLAIFLLFMSLTFYSKPLAERVTLIINESFVYGQGYITLDFICKSLRVIYSGLCLALIFKYKDLLKTTHSSIERVNITWLKLLVAGFLIIVLLEWLLSLAKVGGLISSHNMTTFERIGLTGYYSMFVLVNVLIFSSMRYFTRIEAVSQKNLSRKAANEPLLNPDIARQIDRRMRHEKPYLQADLTLDTLADTLALPARDLSMIINRHFGNNFYEFVNQYRIQEAQRMLCAAEYREKTITDIYLEAGFNSKSVFNTFFKKIVGKTPSQYRQQPEPLLEAG